MRGEDIRDAMWQRCARGFEIRIELQNGVVYKFDGFEREV